jgi:GTP-binding protein
MGVGRFQFLRHVERTSILLHLVDISDIPESDPVNNFEKINRELQLYSPELVKKPQVVAGTKLDIAVDKVRLDRFEQYCKMNKIDFFPVSAVTGSGTKKLLAYLSVKLADMKDKRK